MTAAIHTHHPPARASEQYARRLVWATWALVLATLGLVLVTALQVWRGN